MKKTVPIVVLLGLGIWGTIARNDIVDFFVEGDSNPWYVEAGRHEGVWRFEGDPQKLQDYASGVERIEFRIEDPPSGSWRGKEPPPGTIFLSKDDLTRSRGRGTCVVGGHEYAFQLFSANPHEDKPDILNAWLEFEERPPFLAERAHGNGFELTLEAKLNPANDWLCLYFGRTTDGSKWGVWYTRVE